MNPGYMTAPQQFALVLLRTLIGWHFAYEGYIKLLHPAWGRDGHPLSAWSSAGYLKGATGPFATLFHSLAGAAWIGPLDIVVAVALFAVGVSLLLGWFTQTGCIGAIALLAMFYVSAIPVGLPDSRAEGSYLFVNKNLIELVALTVLFAFRTGRIAGIDARAVRTRRAAGEMKEATA